MDDKDLEKLAKLTKLIKQNKISIGKKGQAKSNKWRNAEPKFTSRASKPEKVVDAGGMQVDPSLQADYEAWRQDKLAEQRDRIAAKERKDKAKRDNEIEPPRKP